MFFKDEQLNFNLYGLGLLLCVGYTYADSQMIIERVNQGNCDYVAHAWLLFTDLSLLFSRILVFLVKRS